MRALPGDSGGLTESSPRMVASRLEFALETEWGGCGLKYISDHEDNKKSTVEQDPGTTSWGDNFVLTTSNNPPP